MDCNAMRQIDPNYLAWVLEELLAGRERNVIDCESLCDRPHDGARLRW